jgi:DNA repair protein RecN (Recombination protein N)
MLLSLRIENFALVDRLDLEFGPGLHVLTGETGAGKSIILDAIDALLGGKLQSRSIRTGTSRALIEGSFRIPEALTGWLATQEIEPIDGDQLVCSREIMAGATVRSRSRLNGVVVNKQQLEALRDRLVEITAQGQTVQLGQASRQRSWLDEFGGTDLAAQRQRVAEAHGHWQAAVSALDRRRLANSQQLQQLDMYKFQAKELAAAGLEDPTELDQLEHERQRLGHAVELKTQSYRVYQLLYDNDNGLAAGDLLGQSEAILQDLLPYDSDLQGLVDLVSEAIAQIQETGRRINDYGSQIDSDPARLDEVENRINLLRQICRKYGPDLVDAIAHYDRIQAELAAVNDGESLEALAATVVAHRKTLDRHCATLTELRRAVADRLEAQLIAELQPLAMNKVKFSVELKPIEPTATGADQVCFLFSPNPGEPLSALSETASGGEMSRFLLALKSCFCQIGASTMIFDEIDTGVSGKVSQAIADKLHQLSRAHQVLCVTHQPIIAARADRHLRVYKQVVDLGLAGEERTVIRIAELNSYDLRRQELAELAGGSAAPEALAFAEVLLARSAGPDLLTDRPVDKPEKSATKPARKPAAKRTAKLLKL